MFRSKRVRRFFKNLTKSILVAQLAFSPSLMALAPERTMPRQHNVKSTMTHPMIWKSLFNDPVAESFFSAPPINAKLNFDPQDPVIDHDPFFLRSQTYLKKGASSAANPLSDRLGGLRFTVDNQGALILQAASGVWTWRLEQPLSPVGLTDEFLFLAPRTGTDFFKSKLPSGPTSQGLFVIRVDDLHERWKFVGQGELAQRVPVHFFPLPGKNWEGAKSGVEVAEFGWFVATDRSNFPLPVHLSDVEELVRVQTLTLMYASGQTVFSDPERYRESFEASQKAPDGKMGYSLALDLPPRGSTAGFGLFLTGLDIDNPTQAIFASAQNRELFSTALLQDLPEFLIRQIVPRAAADPGSLISPDVLERVYFVGSVMSGLFAVSLVLKYTVYKDRLAKKYKDSRSFLTRMKNWGKGSMDVLVHTMQTAMTAPNISFGYLLEYIGDRYFTRVAGSHNGFIRKFLEATVIWSRKSAQSLPINWYTFWLGALVFGSVDSSMVALQLLFVVPYLGDLIGNLHEALAERADRAFSGQNDVSAQFVTSEIVRNVVAYLLTGAHHYSQESRQQVIDLARTQVDADLKQRGIEPLAPKNQAMRDELVERVVEKFLRLRGLPGREDFLFDTPSVVSNISKWAGYKNGEEGKSSVLQKERWGLVAPTLKRALAEAKRRQKEHPSIRSEKVVQIIEGLIKKFHSFGGLVKNPGNYRKIMADYRDVRKQMVLLTYDGPINEVTTYAPESWLAEWGGREACQEAIPIANLLIRQSFFSLLTGDNSLLYPSNQDRLKFEKMALKELTAPGSQDLPFDLTEYDHALRRDQKIQELKEKHQMEEQARNWRPPGGFYARLQKRRAEKLATRALLANRPGITDEDLMINEEVKVQWRSLYTQALAKIVGVHMNPTEDQLGIWALIEEIASEETEKQIRLETGLQEHLDGLPPADGFRLRTELYAMNFLDAYREQMVQSDDLAHELFQKHPPARRFRLFAFLPEQPGRLQWLRQKQVVMKSPLLTGFLRGLEASFDSGSHVLGFWPQVFRSVPMVADLWRGLIRGARNLPLTGSVGYLTNYHIWQVKFSYPTFLLFRAFDFFFLGSIQWLTRLLQHLGMKPMEGTMSKIKYGLVYSWVTFFVYIPIMLFADDANAILGGFWQDLRGSTGTAVDQAIDHLQGACSSLLSPESGGGTTVIDAAQPDNPLNGP